MSTYSLHRWSVVAGDPYRAPEEMVIRLSGFRDQEERKVTTSIVVSVNGREITTYSGSVYILEDIDPDYLKYLDNMGKVYDPENPIKVKD